MIVLNILIHIPIYHTKKTTKQDPSVLLVSMNYPDMAATVFEYTKEEFSNLPMGLSKVTDESLNMQLFHIYYEEYSDNFWMNLDYDKKIRTAPEKSGLQATRSNLPLKNGMKIRKVPNTDYFNILYYGKCLTVDNYTSIRGNYLPLRFRPCIDDSCQYFAFISDLKAKCFLGSSKCTDEPYLLRDAENIVKARVDRFVMDFD